MQHAVTIPRPRRRGVPLRLVAEVGGLLVTLGGSLLALAAGSVAAHAVLGLAFAAMAAVHLARRARTVGRIARKGWARMQPRTKRRMLIDAASVALVVALVPSGVLAWAGLGGGGLHGLAGIVLLGALGAHLLLHRVPLAAIGRRLVPSAHHAQRGAAQG